MEGEEPKLPVVRSIAWLDVTLSCTRKPCEETLNEKCCPSADQAPTDKLHRLLANARCHICGNFAFAFQGINVLREVELAYAAMHENGERQYANDNASIIDAHYI